MVAAEHIVADQEARVLVTGSALESHGRGPLRTALLVPIIVSLTLTPVGSLTVALRRVRGRLEGDLRHPGAGNIEPASRNGNSTPSARAPGTYPGGYDSLMPPYKEQGIVLRSHKLGEADKIVTIMTQGSGKVRAVAKGIRKTTSRFGARLEPFTHVNLMLYRGRGSLDTVTQAEIIAPHAAIRDDLALFAAGETMLEAVDKVAEEHEKNVRVVLLLLAGLPRARRAARRSGRRGRVLHAEAAVALRVPSVAHGVCGVRRDRPAAVLRRAGRRGVRADVPRRGAATSSARRARRTWPTLALADLGGRGRHRRCPRTASRKESRALLYGFAEYHLERRMKSVPMLVRTAR